MVSLQGILCSRKESSGQPTCDIGALVYPENPKLEVTDRPISLTFKHYFSANFFQKLRYVVLMKIAGLFR